ncbi:MAG: alpha/beta hydrolase [Bacillota bacterium]
MKPRIVYLHGNQATHWSFAWAAWLKRELESRGFETFFETLPDSIIGRSEYWLPFLEEHVGVGENDILVGWSTGAIAAMRYVEKHKIKGSVLIGTYHTDLGDEFEKQSGYFNEVWNWDAIKTNQEWIAQFASLNDPVIPIEEGRFVHEKLATEYHEFDDKFHFGWPEPMETFPELLDVLIKHS